ncbi:polysaccharide deacetylase family protein [Granulicella sp. WH15]|uniref:polysaccharide deacetylase family protein n=1 Tax=Granulicella sp. WH15 TaxID=2602070 RepID=UPI0021024C6C|nr:polysaccharide deacetylase family protein [Granulicella sp. WH15]
MKKMLRRFSLLLSLALLATTLPVQAQQIAFTWDDLPAHSKLPLGDSRVEIGRKLMAAMKAEHMPPVYGFVNGIRTEEEPLSTPMLQGWRDAGLPLGNHTWSHLNLNQHTVEEWEAEVLKNEPLLKQYMAGQDWHWLRYPNLAEGNTPEKREAARKFLAEHGYKIAGVTMSFRDYAYNDPYARCVAKHDDAAIAQLEASYLAAADATIGYTRAMAKTLYGHDIPYVLLMHVGALDARMLPRLLKLYRSRGFSFVSLEDAEKDPFYKNDLDLSLPSVPDTLEEAMRARGLPVAAHPEATVDLNTICR